MKPAAFEYHDPTTQAEVLSLLAQLGDEAKLLAGGQSLVPMLNFRLARPAHLVDLNRVTELDYLSANGDGLRIGAMTRQRTVERSAAVAERWPLLTEAIRYIGHVQIRTRGTIGGSLAHADPSAELPAVMSAFDGQLVLRSEAGERTVPAEAFFQTYLTTALKPTEILAEVRVPELPPGSGYAFQEISRRHGDFALVGVAALLTLDPAGAVGEARLAFTGAGPVPVRARAAEQALVGRAPTEEVFHEVAAMAQDVLETDADLHASAEYRREVAGVLARRALVQAAQRAAAAPRAPAAQEPGTMRP